MTGRWLRHCFRGITTVGSRETVQETLYVRTTVQDGGRIEIADSSLRPGDAVEVIVLVRQGTGAPPQSILDIVADAPAHRLYRTPGEVDEYVRAERESWD